MKKIAAHIFTLFFIFAFSQPANAKLANLPYDTYIRHSDIIAEGTVLSKFNFSNMVLYRFKVNEYYFGNDSSVINLIYHTGKYWKEDQPEWSIGEKAILLLTKNNFQGIYYYDCFFGYDCKILVKGNLIYTERFPFRNKNEFVKMISIFINIRNDPDTNKSISTLIKLLDTKDIAIMRAASNYLNFLVNHEDYESTDNAIWNQFGNYSYPERYMKYEYYNRGKWRKWWIERTFHKQQR
jgi:hypothetical protein